MDVHATPAGLPELREFLAGFHMRFRRPEGRIALERYPTGLLTELSIKNGDTIAQAVPGTSEQHRHEFLTNMPWDEEDLNRQQVQRMLAEVTLGEGVLVLDDTGFPKQGKASVGVARQYYGSNLPAAATLEALAGYAHRRHAVEQCHDPVTHCLPPALGRRGAEVLHQSNIRLPTWQRREVGPER